jgi:hypothetical protein
LRSAVCHECRHRQASPPARASIRVTPLDPSLIPLEPKSTRIGTAEPRPRRSRSSNGQRHLLSPQPPPELPRPQLRPRINLRWPPWLSPPIPRPGAPPASPDSGRPRRPLGPKTQLQSFNPF